MTKIQKYVLSSIIGILLAYLLLSRIDPRDIPRALSGISLVSVLISFFLYTISVFLKALRFKVILSTKIKIFRLFPIVSLYMFFSNILPMRAGELSYVYLLKKEESTSGVKSFASLIISAFGDILILIFAMFLVGWHLRKELIAQTNDILSYLKSNKVSTIGLNHVLVIILVIFLAIFMILLSKRKKLDKQSRISNEIKAKVTEVINEIKYVKFDKKFLIIVLLSFLIILFRFLTQWYIVKSMNLAIGIWEFSFAILFGVLFSLIPIHGPAGIGTVEAPYVLSLVYLEVPKNDAITSGFVLHILIILFTIILGIYGIFNLKILKSNV
ncbi:MAG: lysylphosphatidylglycerol synthase transmembrane domain-containing protein [bacterium]